jgi:hypothetical protein
MKIRYRGLILDLELIPDAPVKIRQITVGISSSFTDLSVCHCDISIPSSCHFIWPHGFTRVSWDRISAFGRDFHHSIIQSRLPKVDNDIDFQFHAILSSLRRCWMTITILPIPCSALRSHFGFWRLEHHAF